MLNCSSCWLDIDVRVFQDNSIPFFLTILDDFNSGRLCGAEISPKQSESMTYELVCWQLHFAIQMNMTPKDGSRK